MELQTLVRSAGRGVWLLLILPPVVGGLVVASVSANAERTYTVSIGALLPATGTTGSAANTQSAANVAAVVQLPEVTVSAAQAADVSLEGVGAVTAEQATPGSAVITFSATGPSVESAEAGVKAVANEAMAYLLQPEVESAESTYEGLLARSDQLSEQGAGAPYGAVQREVLRLQRSSLLTAATEAKVRSLTAQSRLRSFQEAVSSADPVVVANSGRAGVLRQALLAAAAAAFLLVSCFFALALWRVKRPDGAHHH